MHGQHVVCDEVAVVIEHQLYRHTGGGLLHQERGELLTAGVTFEGRELHAQRGAARREVGAEGGEERGRAGAQPEAVRAGHGHTPRLPTSVDRSWTRPGFATCTIVQPCGPRIVLVSEADRVKQFVRIGGTVTPDA